MIVMNKNQKITFVTFNLEDDEYGLDISQISAIIKKPKIVKIPKSPDFVEGLINVRGEVLTVISLRKKLNFPEADGEHIIVMNLGEKKFGMLVDRVNQMIHVEKKNLKTSSLSGKIKNQYLDRVAVVNKKIIIVLNPHKIFSEEDLQS